MYNTVFYRRGFPVDIQLKRGLLEICALASMLKEDVYGYKLIRSVSPFIEISESTLYPILKRLEAAGHIRAYSVEHNSRLRKYYEITSSGRERIKEFLQDWESVMQVYTYIEGEYNNDKK